MQETIAMLMGAGKFIGSVLMIFGGIWLFLEFKEANKITGPILLIIAGAIIFGLAGDFGGAAGGL